MCHHRMDKAVQIEAVFPKSATCSTPPISPEDNSKPQEGSGAESVGQIESSSTDPECLFDGCCNQRRTSEEIICKNIKYPRGVCGTVYHGFF